MCTIRDKAAMFNAEYKALVREAIGRHRIYNQSQMYSITQNILGRTILFAYEQENCLNATELEKEYLQFYASDDSRPEPLQNKLIKDMICESDEVWLKIQETYPVRNCEIKRYLPIVTVFLLMHGTQLLMDKGDKALEKMQFSAFWIFNLNCDNKQIKMHENNTWISDILSKEIREQYTDESELGGLILQQYYKLLKELFPAFTQKRMARLDLEFQRLEKEIIRKDLMEIAPVEPELANEL